MTRTIAPPPALSPADVTARLAEGWTMIASNGHLAHEWKRRFAEAMSTSGRSVCETPPVFSWNEWLRWIVRRNTELPMPLSREQEINLWLRVISRDDAESEQPGPRQLALAGQAMRAYAIMRDYAIDAADLLPGNIEHETFHRWIGGVRQEMKQAPDRILVADLPAMLAARDDVFTEAYVLTDGFDPPTPVQGSLFAAMQDRGVDISTVARDPSAGNILLSACEDEAHELRHAAMRISELLRESPTARIGIVHPSPRDIIARLARELDGALSPAAAFGAHGEPAVLTGTASSIPETPLGRLAVASLSLLGEKSVPFSDLSPLLLSPYIRGHTREWHARARLETALRADNQHVIWLPTALPRPAWQDVPEFVQVIESLLAWDGSACMASEWTRKLRMLWQGMFGLNERMERSGFETRQINGLGEALGALAALDHDGRPLSWHDFTGLLRQTLSEVSIAVPTSGQVELLSIDQAAGLKFDHVLALGLDEERWPLPASPNPFIPVSVQQRAGIPRASAEQAFDESERLWRHLLRAAPAIEASFSRQREGKEVLPSPMLDLKPQPVAPLPPPWAALMPQVRLEVSAFEAVPLVGDRIRGGAGGLKDQSACPFRYFAARRLGIEALQPTEPGLTAMDRGTLVHRVMELIWARLGDQAGLLTLLDAPDDLQSLVNEAVHQAWKSIDHPVDRDVRRLESRRLQGLIWQWLQLEGERPAFKACEREAWRSWRFEHKGTGWRLNLKLDRVDRDAEGRKLILDYKTGGKSNPGDWLGERPNEPQLPLYAVIEGEEQTPDAVAFARLRAGELGFEGLADGDVGIGGIQAWNGRDEMPDDWHGLIDLWRRRLLALGVEIAEGRNDVAPRDDRACEYCDLKAVCRIDALREGLA